MKLIIGQVGLEGQEGQDGLERESFGRREEKRGVVLK
jgi:hypothetical protein